MQDDSQQGPSVDEVERLLAGEAAEPESHAQRSQGENEGEHKAVPMGRFNEVNQRMRELERQNAQLMERMLQQPQQSGQQYQEDPLADLDPEVRGGIQQMIQSSQNQVLEALAPLLQNARRNMGMEIVEGALPGFKDDLQGEVDAMFDSLSPEEQKAYDSEIGAQALAARVLHARLQKMQQQGPTMAQRRAVTAGGMPAGPAPGRRGGADPAAVDKAVARMPQDNFDALVERIKEGQLRKPG